MTEQEGHERVDRVARGEVANAPDPVESIINTLKEKNKLYRQQISEAESNLVVLERRTRETANRRMALQGALASNEDLMRGFKEPKPEEPEAEEGDTEENKDAG